MRRRRAADRASTRSSNSSRISGDGREPFLKRARRPLHPRVDVLPPH